MVDAVVCTRCGVEGVVVAMGLVSGWLMGLVVVLDVECCWWWIDCDGCWMRWQCVRWGGWVRSTFVWWFVIVGDGAWRIGQFFCKKISLI